MKKALVIALFAFGVLGCSSNGEAEVDPQGNTTDDGLTFTEVETTSLAACSRPPTEQTKLSEGMWHQEFTGSDGVIRRYVYEFDEDSIFVQAYCSGDGIEVRSRLGAAATITESTIQIVEDDESVNAGTGLSGNALECKAAVKASGIKNYTFVGPCLQFEENGVTTTFAPSY